MPRDTSDISYDADSHSVTIADGLVTGVRPEVWGFEVSGMPVVRKWLGYRTAKGAGKAASSSSALDRIRPEEWPDAWNDELLDLLRLLTITLDQQEALTELLDRICDGPLVAADELPHPSDAERRPPNAPGETGLLL